MRAFTVLTAFFTLLVLAVVMPSGTGLCQTYDIGVISIDAPPNSVWPGEQYTRKATVKNYGTETQDFFWVYFDMCHGQDLDSMAVYDLAPGHTLQVSEFLEWVVPNEICFDCTMRVWCHANMDEDPTNDSLEKLIRIGDYELGLISIYSPGDTVIADSSYVPEVKAINSGAKPESLNIECLIGSVYGDTQAVGLLPGWQLHVWFSPWHVPLVETTYTVSFRILDSLDCDTANNYLEKQVYTKVIPGIAEHTTGGCHIDDFSIACTPNPFVQTVVVSWSAGLHTQAVLQVYDVTGRLVRTLAESSIPGRQLRAMWDGRDETGKEMESGVYFICLKAGYEMSYAKVVRVR
jgi:hypothetical protein